MKPLKLSKSYVNIYNNLIFEKNMDDYIQYPNNYIDNEYYEEIRININENYFSI